MVNPTARVSLVVIQSNAGNSEAAVVVDPTTTVRGRIVADAGIADCACCAATGVQDSRSAGPGVMGNWGVGERKAAR